MSLFELALAVVVALAVLVAWWNILARAGYPGALALLVFVPLVNLALLLWFAFARWPALRRPEPPPPSAAGADPFRRTPFGRG